MDGNARIKFLARSEFPLRLQVLQLALRARAPMTLMATAFAQPGNVDAAPFGDLRRVPFHLSHPGRGLRWERGQDARSRERVLSSSGSTPGSTEIPIVFSTIPSVV